MTSPCLDNHHNLVNFEQNEALAPIDCMYSLLCSYRDKLVGISSNIQIICTYFFSAIDV